MDRSRYSAAHQGSPSYDAPADESIKQHVDEVAIIRPSPTDIVKSSEIRYNSSNNRFQAPDEEKLIQASNETLEEGRETPLMNDKVFYVAVAQIALVTFYYVYFLALTYAEAEDGAARCTNRLLGESYMSILTYGFARLPGLVLSAAWRENKPLPYVHEELLQQVVSLLDVFAGPLFIMAYPGMPVFACHGRSK